MTEKEFQEEMERAKRRNKRIERRRLLREEKHKYGFKLNVETSKLLALYLFLLLNVIIIYSMVAMWMFADFTYLGVLITDIAAQVLIYAIYCLKAYNGKKQEELLKFWKENKGEEPPVGDSILDAGAESDAYVPTNIDLGITTEVSEDPESDALYG